MTSTASADGGPAGSSYARGKCSGGPVLDEAEQAVAVAEVERPPRRPSPPRPARPSAPSRRPAAARLPEDAVDADRAAPCRGRRPRSPARGGTPSPARRVVLSAALSVRIVASGRARNRNGHEGRAEAAGDVERRLRSSKTPSQYGRARWARRILPPGAGRQIWPPCRWPASTSWKAPGGRRSTRPGKWQRRMRRSAVRIGELARAGSRRRRGSLPRSAPACPRPRA